MQTKDRTEKYKNKNEEQEIDAAVKVINSRSPVTVELQAGSVADWSSEEHCCYPTAAAAEGRMTERVKV